MMPLAKVDSEAKTIASANYSSTDDNNSARSKIPVAKEANAETNARKIPVYHLVDEPALSVLKQELISSTKDIMHKFMEDISSQFLKVRMGVGREFCIMETSHNKRWQEFNVTLLNLAGFEEPKKERDIASDIYSGSDETEVLGSKQQDSIYTKTKITNYSQQKSPTLKGSER